MKSAIAKKENFDLQKGITAIFLKLCKHDEIYEEIENRLSNVEIIVDEHDNRIEEQEAKIDLLQKQITNLEIESFKNKFVFKKVPIWSQVKIGQKEDQNASLEVMSEILSLSNQNISEIDECFRFYPKNGEVKEGPPNLFVKFSCTNSAMKFFNKINEIKKNENFKDLSVDRMVPRSLLKDFLAASAVAYRLRKELKLVARVEIINGKIEVISKKKGEKEFQITPY